MFTEPNVITNSSDLIKVLFTVGVILLPVLLPLIYHGLKGIIKKIRK